MSIEVTESGSVQYPSLTLYYLPFRARAEAIRTMLNFAKIPFKDIVISLEDWPKYKAEGIIAPFHQLPALAVEDDGEVEIIAQSGAIIRYVARLANLLPSDPLSTAKADMIYEFAQDLNIVCPLMNFWPMHSETWKSNFNSFFTALPGHLHSASKILQQEQKRAKYTMSKAKASEFIFFGGDKPNHGDFAFFNILDSALMLNPRCLDDFPTMISYTNNMRELKGIKDYFSQRTPPSDLGMFGSFIQSEAIKSALNNSNMVDDVKMKV